MWDLVFMSAMSFLLLFLGFKQEDYAISVLPSFFLGYVGVWIIGYGIEEIQNNLTQAFGIMLIGVALYIVLRGAYELVKGLRWKGLKGMKEQQ